MKKILLTLIITALFAVPYLAAHTQYDGPNARRGCIASAYQADARGVAGSSLEANLEYCEQLLSVDKSI